MKYLRLLVKMTRWRVLPTLLIFMLIGASWAGHLRLLALLIAAIGLAASYACATSVNDLADFQIDKVNLPNDADRPLVVGAAKPRDLIVVASMAAIIALICGLALSLPALALIALSLVINLAYSLKPIQISHHPILAPLFLPFGYVVVPFLIGITTTGSGLKLVNLILLLGLYLLFVGRIILKDFRDRKGDALGGKKTFLLQYGKKATILVSLSAVLMGYGIIIPLIIKEVGAPALLLALFALANIGMLYRLYSAPEGTKEQAAIGVGAKMGNGMLLLLIALLVLKLETAKPPTLLAVSVFFVFLYGYNFVLYLLKPEESVIAYKR